MCGERGVCGGWGRLQFIESQKLHVLSDFLMQSNVIATDKKGYPHIIFLISR